MRENDVLVFLLSLGALLSSSRLIGEIGRRIGLPLVVGELFAGIVLGPTIMGRLAPGAQHWLFPTGGPQLMLGGYTTVGVVLLLVVAGLEVDLQVVMRRGRAALYTSVLGIVLPLAGGVLLGFLLPDSDLVFPEQRVLFALFIGVALSISALPVIAKTLLDLGLFKTDIGLLVMTAAMVGDLIGWLGFSVLMGPMHGGGIQLMAITKTIALTLGFVAACMLLGRRLVGNVIARMEKDSDTAPRRVLSLVVLLALLGAGFTQAVGVHAVFGGFVVGVMVGDSPHFKERTRVVIHEFVTSIFAPVFFASLGLRVDFVRAFDLRLCLLVFAIASVAKVAGCTVGARFGGLKWRSAAAVGFGLNARGAMEIILALLALEAGLIKEQVFVALVVMALLTSLISGPMMKWLLGDKEEDLVGLLRQGAFVPTLSARTATEAIEELISALGTRLGRLSEAAQRAVIERENVASTGLGDEVAIPHAAVEGLSKPVLALGRSSGIDFDAPDGRPARIVILLLMPPHAYDHEVRVLASIARALIDADSRDQLLRAKDLEQVIELLGAESAKKADARARRTQRTSLGDI